MSTPEHKPYVTVMKGVTGFCVALYEWKHSEDDYEITKASKAKTKEQADARVVEWASAFNADIRE